MTLTAGTNKGTGSPIRTPEVVSRRGLFRWFRGLGLEALAQGAEHRPSLVLGWEQPVETRK